MQRIGVYSGRRTRGMLLDWLQTGFILVLLLSISSTSALRAPLSFQLKSTSNVKIFHRLALHASTSSTINTPFEDPEATINLRGAFVGIRKDVIRRLPHYRSDWVDGFRRKKTYAAASFLYFACLAPIVAFGGLLSSITKGQMGVIEFLVSCGASGIMYALFSGQPMTLLGPTGLTLAFITTLYRFTEIHSLPFLPLYACTGLWTSLFLLLTAVFNLSNLMKYCTVFTDDCFNSLLVVNFLYEALSSLAVNFTRAQASLVSALASLNIALATWLLTFTASAMPQTRVFTKKIRKRLSNFGPTLVILLMSAVVAHPRLRALGIQTLAVPSKFTFSNSRPWLVSLASLTPRVRLLCALPALLLTMLFYLDQNISVRAANQTGLSKGPAYHLDMLVLAASVGGLSVCGLPWTCAATVQTLNHIRAMSTVEVVQGKETFSNILETRVTGLLVHSAILATLFLLPYMSLVPMPVISGIFLFLGQKLMKGNLYLERMSQILDEKSLLPADSVYRRLPLPPVLKYLTIQSLLLGLIWWLKSHKSLSLFFPGCVALLMVTRKFFIPRIFSDQQIAVLDPVE